VADCRAAGALARRVSTQLLRTAVFRHGSAPSEVSACWLSYFAPREVNQMEIDATSAPSLESSQSNLGSSPIRAAGTHETLHRNANR
jgi:hypothetical protein